MTTLFTNHRAEVLAAKREKQRNGIQETLAGMYGDLLGVATENKPPFLPFVAYSASENPSVEGCPSLSSTELSIALGHLGSRYRLREGR